jgi:anti-anti-sigma factor
MEKIAIKITNKIEEIQSAIDHFENFGFAKKIHLTAVQKINVALDELLTNIISYGFKDKGEHEIEVDIELENTNLTLIIKDDGVAFDPFENSTPDTSLSIEERNIGGLGIHLVKNLFDEYHYERLKNINIIKLIKNNIKFKTVMSLEINTSEIDDVTIIKLIGNLDTSTCTSAEAEVNNCLEKGVQKMIINLEETKYVSSAGLRIFLIASKKLAASGGVVKLCHANEVVQEILDISGFSTILDVKATEKEALEAL